ncbi:hypothetical protein [Mycobacterium kyorinense]|nr:hypothetical protein [Mycobacterium kyorinense]
MFDAHEQTLGTVLGDYEADQLENVAELLARLTEAAQEHPFAAKSND